MERYRRQGAATSGGRLSYHVSEHGVWPFDEQYIPMYGAFRQICICELEAFVEPSKGLHSGLGGHFSWGFYRPAAQSTGHVVLVRRWRQYFGMESV